MRTARMAVLAFLCLLVGCNSASRVSTIPQPAVRSYNATASVGDFLTISIDSSAQTITYNNYTNGETGTVPYFVWNANRYRIQLRRHACLGHSYHECRSGGSLLLRSDRYRLHDRQRRLLHRYRTDDHRELCRDGKRHDFQFPGWTRLFIDGRFLLYGKLSHGDECYFDRSPERDIRRMGGMHDQFRDGLHSRKSDERRDRDRYVQLGGTVQRNYSDSSSFSSVGLCFSGFFFFSTTIFSAGGAPIRSRANSLTAVTARKRFTFFFFAKFTPPALSAERF